MPYKDFKEFYQDISKDIYMKWIIRFLGTAIAIFIVIQMVIFRMDANNGKHVKLPFFEEGSDTFVKMNVVHDTVQIRDTVRINHPIYMRDKTRTNITNDTKIDHPDKVEIGTVH